MKEALKLALEALKKNDGFLHNWHENYSDDESDHYSTVRQLNKNAIKACEEALKQERKRPQNCGTSYCSCIECVMEQEQGEADELLRYLGLDPQTYRTDGGVINRMKVKAALVHPDEYPRIDEPVTKRKPLTEEQTIILKAKTCPEIDFVARHGVELNNGERSEWLLQWFLAFKSAIEAFHNIKE